MSKIIVCELSKKSNYKKIESVQESVEGSLQESLQENKTIINNNTISEKKSYLQLLDKIKKSITNTNSANGNVIDLSASIIHIYDNYEEQLLCLHKLLNGVVFDEKKYFIQALKNKLDSYKQQDKKKNI